MSVSFGGNKQKSSGTQTTTNQYGIDTYNAAQANLPRNFQRMDMARVGEFMNPFQKNVVDALKAEYGDVAAQDQNAVDAQAMGAGAFGGSRHGVRAAVTASEGQKNLAGLIANLMASGYDRALGAAERENFAENEQPFRYYGTLGNLAGNTQSTTNDQRRGSGLNFGMSYTYGGK